MKMTNREKALAYMKDKFHCSQSVLGAFADQLGLTEEQALKISYCFNSGMRKGEVCGACSGALMVIGMKYGQCDKDDLESRRKADRLTTEFLDAFKKKNGSCICRELLGCDISSPEEAAIAIEKGLFAKICPAMVASAVEILEEIL